MFMGARNAAGDLDFSFVGQDAVIKLFNFPSASRLLSDLVFDLSLLLSWVRISSSRHLLHVVAKRLLLLNLVI